MATNTITVNFTVCTPTPANGYEIRYRPADDVGAFRDAGNFVSSPAVFEDTTDELGTEYEGDIRSDCGGGLFGNWVPWVTDPGSPGGGGTIQIIYSYGNDIGPSGNGSGGHFQIFVNGLLTINKVVTSGGFINVSDADVVLVKVQSTIDGTAETTITGDYSNSTSNVHNTEDTFSAVTGGSYNINGVSTEA